MATALESADLEEKFPQATLAQKSLPFIPAWLDDYGLSAIEFRVYCHVTRRAGKGGKCWESVPRIAKACRLGRNVTLKALHTLTEVYRLLIKNKRPGETDEYSIAPESQWQEPVPQEDRSLSRRIKNAVSHSSVSLEQEPIFGEDDNVIQLMDYQQQPDSAAVLFADFSPTVELASTKTLGLPFDLTQENTPALFGAASLPSTSFVTQTPSLNFKFPSPDSTPQQRTIEVDKPSIWRHNRDATRYCQIPPIYNQAVGVEIQRQIEAEGLTPQAVVERAIAFSKVPKLILETLLAINQKLVDGHQWLTQVLQQQQQAVVQEHKNTTASYVAAMSNDEPEDELTEDETTGIPQKEWKYLKDIDIHLSYELASELWSKYSHKFTRAIAYVDKQEKKGKVHNRAAYFRACLEQGWIKDSDEKRHKRDPYELTSEQMEWYEWAVSEGLCDGRPIRHYGLIGAELGIIVFEPEFQSNASMPLSRAMQKYPRTVN